MVTVAKNATFEETEALIALMRQARDVFPFLPRVVFEKARTEGSLLIARDTQAGTVVGGIHFHHRRDKITTVHEIVVSSELRHQGVGQKLLSALNDAAYERGQRKLRLKCPSNIAANGFYGRSGFQRTSVETTHKRPVIVYERRITDPYAGKEQGCGGAFFASLTNSTSDIRQLMRRFYEGYAGSPPVHPFQNIIFTPLFSSQTAISLFRELVQNAPDPAKTGLIHPMPPPVLMFDSGGYQVQMGKMSYGQLCDALRRFYEKNDWGDYYVLPDHVPTSLDTDHEAAQKAHETLQTGVNFLRWFPERREQFVGVVHGRTPQEMVSGALHWKQQGVRYIAFGAFGTSGPQGSINLVSEKSIMLLRALTDAARENQQRIHVFGIGNPDALRRFGASGVELASYDSANWWKMAGFGYVLAGGRTHRVCQTHRMTRTLADTLLLSEQAKHTCPFCGDETASLRDSRWNRILHNLSTFVSDAAARNVPIN